MWFPVLSPWNNSVMVPLPLQQGNQENLLFFILSWSMPPAWPGFGSFPVGRGVVFLELCVPVR